MSEESKEFSLVRGACGTWDGGRRACSGCRKQVRFRMLCPDTNQPRRHGGPLSGEPTGMCRKRVFLDDGEK